MIAQPKLVPIALAIVLAATNVFAQGSDPTTNDTTITREASNPLRVPSTFDMAAAQSGAAPHQPRLRCCSRKGMIIGGLIGVGVGMFAAAQLAEGDITLRQTIGALVTFGGVGAAIGAFAERNHIPVISVPERRIRITGTISPSDSKPQPNRVLTASHLTQLSA